MGSHHNVTKNNAAHIKIGAIVQARMGSERLPGKSLMEIGGKPLLEYLIENLKTAKYLSTVVLATTTLDEDAVLMELAERFGVCGFRGSENDVLSRYSKAAEANELDVVVRVTGDNILTDIDGMDKAISLYLKDGPDLITNGGDDGYPLGTGVEVLSTNLLHELNKVVTCEEEREHVTLHVYRSRGKYRIMRFKAPSHYRNLNVRLTIDTPEDLMLIRRLYKGINDQNEDFKLPQVLKYLDEHQELKKINEHITQKTF